MFAGEGIGSATVASTAVAKLTLSLDAELLWGHVNIGNPRAVDRMLSDPDEVRGCYQKLLSILHRHRVSATWAMVGHLWLPQCDDRCLQLHAAESATWRDLRLSRPRLFCAPDLLEMILSCGTRQEIGFHGFSHRPFPFMTAEEARSELALGQEVARAHGLRLRSHVFPDNLVAHVGEVAEAGFSTYRSEPIGPVLGPFHRPQLL